MVVVNIVVYQHTLIDDRSEDDTNELVNSGYLIKTRILAERLKDCDE